MELDPRGHHNGPNTLLPHIGYVTTEVYRTWFGEVVEDVLAWADGHPVRVL